MEQRWMKELDLPRDEMEVVKKLASLRRDELAALFGTLQPYLLEIDDTHVRSPLADLRATLRGMAERAPALDDRLRRDMFETVRAAWEADLDIDAVERANADLAAETNDPEILQKTIDVILRKCFIEPLAKEGAEDDARKDELLRRKVILESLFIQMVDEKKWEHADLFVEAHDAYIDRLGLKLGELGYLALVNLVMTDKMDSAEKLRAALH